MPIATIATNRQGWELLMLCQSHHLAQVFIADLSGELPNARSVLDCLFDLHNRTSGKVIPVFFGL